jgi:probable F420-dependent oxidoreductase
MRPFRFSLQASGAASGAAWRALARKAEELGFSTLTVPDHLDDQFGPLVALTSAVEATRSLRVGALVFDNDYRHPVHLAKEIATLDLLSEGRVEFGLGAGWMRSDYEAAGIAYDRPGVRIDRMLEGLAIIKALWADGSATLAGDHYQVSGLQGLPRPYTPGGPPVLIGGGGRRVLTAAARHADIVGFNVSLAAGAIGPEAAQSALAGLFDERVGWVRAAAGERFAQLELQLNTFAVLVVDDPQPMFAAIAPQFGLTPEQVGEVPMVLAGPVEEICDLLHARRERYGFSYISVHAHELDAMAPIVARLAGC